VILNNILFITNLYPSKINNFCGIYNKERIETLKKNNFNVHLMMFPPLFPKRKFFFPFLKLFKLISYYSKIFSYKTPYPKVIPFFNLPGKLAWRWGLIIFELLYSKLINDFLVRNKINLIILSGIDSFVFWFAKNRHRLNVKKVFCIIEGSDLFIGYKKYDPKRKIIPLLENFDKLIFVSRSFKEEIDKIYKFKKYFILPNGYDSNTFFINEKFNKENDIITIISVGGLNYIKGHDILLKSLLYVNFKYKLLIIGDGDYKKRYVEFIQKYKINGEILGYKDKNDIAVLLNKSDIFCLPSRSESFGISAVEAMACGLPVVASRVGGLKDLIVEYENGLFFEPNNPHSLAQALDLATKIKWNKYQIAKNTLDNFSYDIWFKRFNGLVNEN
jgi:glycosyltransferase involved in cell wall biosynthesis